MGALLLWIHDVGAWLLVVVSWWYGGQVSGEGLGAVVVIMEY